MTRDQHIETILLKAEIKAIKQQEKEFFEKCDLYIGEMISNGVYQLYNSDKESIVIPEEDIVYQDTYLDNVENMFIQVWVVKGYIPRRGVSYDEEDAEIREYLQEYSDDRDLSAQYNESDLI